MNSKNQTILGISLGTRTIGYVILQDRELYDWGVKSFREKWSEKKIVHIMRSIERLVEDNDVDNVSIKLPKRFESYITLKVLQNSLNMMFSNRAISVYTSSLNNLKLWYSIDDKSPKSCLEEYVSSHYPVLCRKTNLSDAGHKYYMKLYEALAAAEMSVFLK
jgi:hypothetical protein